MICVNERPLEVDYYSDADCHLLDLSSNLVFLLLLCLNQVVTKVSMSYHKTAKPKYKHMNDLFKRKSSGYKKLDIQTTRLGIVILHIEHTCISISTTCCSVADIFPILFTCLSVKYKYLVYRHIRI